ncbi:hypothetical protein C8F04DRAFT_87775 [Mycena alexandri]|uniref:Uncharacterized protein n=1 Tax=Mycena alexandri TaxID=1745969 RepID=A0AAD6SHS8_9AGAR|nr:hypothetical protein C8F04DRAFT_87775 [Mycena alexandri]
MYAGIARSCSFSWVGPRTPAHMGVCVRYATVYERVHTVRITDAHRPRPLYTPGAPCGSIPPRKRCVLSCAGLSPRATLHPASCRDGDTLERVARGGIIGVESVECAVVHRGAERRRKRTGYTYTARHPTASRPALACTHVSSSPHRYCGGVWIEDVRRWLAVSCTGNELACVCTLPDGRGRGSSVPSASAMSYNAPVFVVRIEWGLRRGSGDSLCPPSCLSLTGADAQASSWEC